MRRYLAVAAVACSIACRSDPPPPAATASPSSAAPPPAASVEACVSPEVRVICAADAVATLVLLHGYGASAADMEPVGRALAAGVPGLAVVVPDGCDPWEKSAENSADGRAGRQWYGLEGLREETPAAHRERAARVRVAAARVQAAVAREIAARGLPSGRVGYAGFSQGAMIAEWIAVHGAPRPRAVVAFSGRFDDDGPGPDSASTPVLLVHGERDRVIPFIEAARAEEALRARGATVERVTRPAMGHAIDDPSIEAARAFLARTLVTSP